MKEIPLTRGATAIVDDGDFDRVSRHSWCFDGRYAMARINRKMVRLHRFIVNAETGQFVDHIDGNKLNNQKSNLRICSKSQNEWNRSALSRNTSGFKGVDRQRGSSKWRAKINVHGRRIHLGLFLDARDAHDAYCEAAKKYHGEFARLN